MRESRIEEFGDEVIPVLITVTVVDMKVSPRTAGSPGGRR